MPYFAYKGRNARGDLVQGTLEGNDSGAIADQLFNTGITPVAINPTASRPTGKQGLQWWKRLAEERIDDFDVMLFSRQMHTLLKSGVPILRALAGLQESIKKPTMVRVIDDLRLSLDSGRDLSTSMFRHPDVFSPFYISLVRVGEATGLLDEVFLRLFQHIEFEREIRQRIKAALRYPAFVIIAMAIAVTIINILVIPVFAKVFTQFGSELPLMTRILIGTSNVFVSYWPLMLAGLIAAGVAWRTWLKTAPGRYAWDRYKLRLPIAGPILLKASLARFARSFALCIKSGVPIVQALNVVSNVADNAYVAATIEQMRDGVERGESVLRTAMTTSIFTPVVLQMIAVGDETGEIDDLMFEVAEMYEREVDHDVKGLAAQIEPILIMVLAGFVLVLALGILLPIWDLGSVMLKK